MAGARGRRRTYANGRPPPPPGYHDGDHRPPPRGKQGGGGGGGGFGGFGGMTKSRPSDDAISYDITQAELDQNVRWTTQAAIGFQGYNVETEDPFAGFHHITIAYCIMAFVLMYPFVVCVHSFRENRKRSARPSELQASKQQQEGEVVSPPASEILQSFGGGELTKQVPPNSGKDSETTQTPTTVMLPPQSGSTCSAPMPPYGDNDKENPTNLPPVPVTPTTTKSTLQDEDKPLSDSVPTLPSVGRTHVLLQSQQPSSRSQHTNPHMHPQSRQASQVASGSGILSRIPSAATTGRLHSASARGRSASAWPRPRHSRRPSGDPSWHWKRAIQTERRHRSRRIEQILAQRGGGDPNKGDSPSNSMLFRLRSGAQGVMSDLANSVLTAEHKDHQQLQQQQQQQQHANANQQRSSKVSPNQQQQQHQQPMSASENALYSRKAMAMRQRPVSRRPSNNGSARSGSLRSWGGYPSSVMSSVVDDISPQDAADADDPGKVRIFPGSPNSAHSHAHHSPMAAACCMALEPWLDVAEPNDEFRRLLGLAFPVTVGAMVEPMTRLILTGIISHLIGTHAMVAFLLVHLLYRMSGETLSVAITDAESTLVQMALTSTATENNHNGSSTFTREGYRLAGQYVQLGCLLQVIIVGIVLLLWYFFIEDVVLWWVDSEEMASLAKEYFQVILILFLVQALYRAIMVPCHMRGSEHSTIESIMDIAVSAITLITVLIVLSKTTDIPGEYPEHLRSEKTENYSMQERQDDSRMALVTTAWIQVNIGIAACILKVAFCIVKGWLDNFWNGLLQNVAILNFAAFCNLLLTSIPLIFGAVLELGEVDLLTLFVQAIGPAEVATWALFASMWDVLEASTEGISEAAAIRVAYHLSATQPILAKKLAHKALFWTIVQALLYTSVLLLAGRHIIVALTVDYTLQHLLDQLIGLMALANLSMAFAHVCWSLVGAQGRFNLATLVMLVCRWLVTMPLSLIFIFAMKYDEETLAGAIAMGTATSACVLATILFSSDWNDVAQELYLQGLLSCDDDDDFDFSFGDDDDDSDDSDDDSFGVGAGGYPSNKKSMEDDSDELPIYTEPTTHTGTNTGSGVNSGHSGVISGGTVSGVSGS